MKYWLLLVLGFCSSIVDINARQQGSYLNRAEETFSLIWDNYRVSEHGLFSEYYPNNYKPDLDYFQGDVKQAKEVSFLWPMSGVFSSVTVLMEINPVKYASYLDSMVTAVEEYLDTTRTPYGYQAYPVKFEKADRYYDDNGLVGIDYIDSYNITKNPLYLQRAKDVMTFIESGWTDDFGGGVSWLEGIRDQKPACSNGKATVLALKIYQATGEKKYLHYGMKSYSWMMSMLRDDSLNIIWNALLTPEGTRCEVQKHPYTYNTGTMIQAAVRLYKITGNPKFLEDAKGLAEGTYEFYFGYTEEGIPYVKDMPWFTLVLFRGYQELYDIDNDPKYIDAVIECADWAWEHARDKEKLGYHDWTGKTDESQKPKWLLDSSCMVELYARIAIIKNEKH